MTEHPELPPIVADSAEVEAKIADVRRRLSELASSTPGRTP